MLSYKDSLKILKETNALIDGHFVLSSGLHSAQYIQCAQLLSKPSKAEAFCASLAKKILAAPARNEPPFFQKQPDFCRYLLIGVSPDPNFFERNCMMLENVLDTQNMVVGRQENFLRQLEVGFHSPKVFFHSDCSHEIWLPNLKNPKFFTFPRFSQD